MVFVTLSATRRHWFFTSKQTFSAESIYVRFTLSATYVRRHGRRCKPVIYEGGFCVAIIYGDVSMRTLSNSSAAVFQRFQQSFLMMSSPSPPPPTPSPPSLPIEMENRSMYRNCIHAVLITRHHRF
jgi:hypothetical protein